MKNKKPVLKFCPNCNAEVETILHYKRLHCKNCGKHLMRILPSNYPRDQRKISKKKIIQHKKTYRQEIRYLFHLLEKISNDKLQRKLWFGLFRLINLKKISPMKSTYLSNATYRNWKENKNL